MYDFNEIKLKEMPRKLDEKDFHYILALSPTLVAKVPKETSEFHIENLRDEFHISKMLYKNKIHTPKPEGLFSIPSESGKVGFVMERLYGINGMHFKMPARGFIQDRYDQEIENCKKIGFIPHDTGIHQCIYSRKKDSLYLFDFTQWSIEAPSLLI